MIASGSVRPSGAIRGQRGTTLVGEAPGKWSRTISYSSSSPVEPKLAARAAPPSARDATPRAVAASAQPQHRQGPAARQIRLVEPRSPVAGPLTLRHRDAAARHPEYSPKPMRSRQAAGCLEPRGPMCRLCIYIYGETGLRLLSTPVADQLERVGRGESRFERTGSRRLPPGTAAGGQPGRAAPARPAPPTPPRHSRSLDPEQDRRSPDRARWRAVTVHRVSSCAGARPACTAQRSYRCICAQPRGIVENAQRGHAQLFCCICCVDVCLGIGQYGRSECLRRFCTDRISTTVCCAAGQVWLGRGGRAGGARGVRCRTWGKGQYGAKQ